MAYFKDCLKHYFWKDQLVETQNFQLKSVFSLLVILILLPPAYLEHSSRAAPRGMETEDHEWWKSENIFALICYARVTELVL